MGRHRTPVTGRHRLKGRAPADSGYWCTRTIVLLSLFVAVLAVVTPFGFRVVPEDLPVAQSVAFVSADTPAAVGSCWR